MPWESVGECGHACAKTEKDWMVAQTELAVAYILHVCGDPPAGCEVGVMWHEYDIVDYCTVGLCWEFPDAEYPPWDYLNRAEIALRAFNDGVNWSEINPDFVRDEFADEEE